MASRILQVARHVLVALEQRLHSVCAVSTVAVIDFSAAQQHIQILVPEPFLSLRDLLQAEQGQRSDPHVGHSSIKW